MMRGDVVLVSGKGDYGKARPAIVVQADYLIDGLDSLTVCPLTSDILNREYLRVALEPTAENGLKRPSDMMVDKLQTYPKAKVFGPVGHIAEVDIRRLDAALSFFLQLGPI